MPYVAVSTASTERSTRLSRPVPVDMDSSLARRHGFQSSVRTVYQAVQEDLM